MLKPNVISEVAVLIHAIIIRSYAARVRANASWVRELSASVPCSLRSAIRAAPLVSAVDSSLSLMAFRSDCAHVSQTKFRQQNLRAEQQHPDWKDERDPSPIGDNQQQQ